MSCVLTTRWPLQRAGVFPGCLGHACKCPARCNVCRTHDYPRLGSCAEIRTLVPRQSCGAIVAMRESLCVGHPGVSYVWDIRVCLMFWGQARVVTGPKMGGRCISTGAGAPTDPLITLSCKEASADDWIIWSDEAPHLRWAKNNSLCLTTINSNGPGPGPGPPSPSPRPSQPYVQVPQACT